VRQLSNDRRCNQDDTERSRLYEPVETAALIPHMLEALIRIRADRAWRSRQKRTEQLQAGKRRASPTSSTTPPRRSRQIVLPPVLR